MAYEFHYTPTGTGVISGKEVLEQTEDAINDLGNTAISGVQEALDKAEQALTNSANAVDDAQTALNTANNAEGVAIQAQTDVSNLSGTVTNIGNRVTTAEGNISNLQGRMTTAEGNITNIQGRMTTAESNIGNLQTAVSTAQATANSAQQTATTARQQSYVFRYSGTAVVPNSTIAYSTIDNTDNIKAGDKILDVDGKLFKITAVDTTNQAVTVGSALIDLAQDSDVVHKSGVETITGVKTITDTNLEFKSTSAEYGVSAGDNSVIFKDKNNLQTFKIYSRVFSSGLDNNLVSFFLTQKVDNTYYISNGIQLFTNTGNKNAVLRPILANNNADGLSVLLGDSNRRWQSVYAINYYYGNDNVEFSTKFVTTDTAQTVTGSKTFSSSINVYNSDSTGNVSNIVLKNSKAEVGTEFAEQSINFVDKNNNPLAKISCYGSSGNYTRLYITASDSNNNSEGIFIRKSTTEIAILPTISSTVWMGHPTLPFYNVHTNRVNGLTPSSLGMPVIDRTKYVDISGYFTNTGNGDINTYSVTANGWIYLRLTDIGGCQLSVLDSSNNRLYGSTSSGNLEQLCLPVTAGTVVEAQWTTSTSVTVSIARFIPCQGNI